MKMRLSPLIAALLLALLPGCAEGQAGTATEGAEPAEATSSGDTKYAIGGRVRPAWVETLKLVTESLSLTTTGNDLHRASKLALAATELAAENPNLLGYAELTLAFSELRRGKIESFERLAVRGLGRIPPDAKHTELALLAAEQSVRRGRLDPSRIILGLWRKRLDKAGEKALAEKVESIAAEHLERVRGKKKTKKTKTIEPPPSDFPIVLPN